MNVFFKISDYWYFNVSVSFPYRHYPPISFIDSTTLYFYSQINHILWPVITLLAWWTVSLIMVRLKFWWFEKNFSKVLVSSADPENCSRGEGLGPRDNCVCPGGGGVVYVNLIRLTFPGGGVPRTPFTFLYPHMGVISEWLNKMI